MRKCIYILGGVVLLVVMSACQQSQEKILPLEVVSVPEAISIGRDFEITVRTAPFASCQLDMPFIRLDFSDPEIDSKSYELHKYSTANSDGIAHWFISADEIYSQYPFSLSIHPPRIPAVENDVEYSYVEFIIYSTHPDYAEKVGIVVNIKYEPTSYLLS